MKFVHPHFLWALFLIAIPIIIHLFHFRRYKRILFSNTQFLEELKEQQATKNNLKHILVLLSRILAIVFLVLAFAQPYIPNKNNAIGQKLINIYIDNSFSMLAEGKGYLLLDEAKFIAQEIVESYSESNQFQIQNNDFEANQYQILSQSEAIEAIKKIAPSSETLNKSFVFEKQKNSCKKVNLSKIFYQISDFQKTNELADLTQNETLELINIQAENIRNISVKDIQFESPVPILQQKNTLFVTFENHGNEEVSGSYQLQINEQTKSLGNYTIPATSQFTDTLVFTIDQLGWNKGKISINDFPLEFDDELFFTFNVANQIKVYSIFEGNGNRFTKAVFTQSDLIQYQEALTKNINYNAIKEQNLVILSNIENIPSGLQDALVQFVENGGNLLIFPNKKATVTSYNQLLSSLNAGTITGKSTSKKQAKVLNSEHSLLQGIFQEKPTNIELPFANESFIVTTNLNQFPILSFADGNSFLYSSANKNGQVFISTVALDKAVSNFKDLAYFAPICFKTALISDLNSNLYATITSSISVPYAKMKNQQEEIVKVSNDQLEIIPMKANIAGRTFLQFPGKAIQSGYYQIQNSFEEELTEIALNYNREESHLDYFSVEEMQDFYVNESVNIYERNISIISEGIKQLEEGKSFWKLCIILALLFLAIEILLIRFFAR